MSWLFVALVPGLLMMATFGLERVEAGLRRDAFSPADVGRLLDAEVGRGERRIRSHPQALPTANGRRGNGRIVEPVPTPDLPTPQYLQHLANTEFRQTRHANRV
ncbi:MULTISPECIES: hypothetical protein [Mycolicibacterium]|uniref:Uncharacterized protein n=3 Tax=Mycolicibacterium gilvum TaxID=1804 RepID=E6TIL4_MYCSR|nr:MULTISPECIES: hypothetical protein [Mycolicibacterium]ABP43854.1 putative membrane protein [Mycolicibacterium gilvum PYR-GCK]ADU01342.1 hypothetical protein Mspyr1_48010 [Mycolicibacterium gilvum Spyr1]MBV5243720.1 hypothetical protein [Mycolicibacterium sp. PAM1]MCV7057977.1 hypothetical protein [Mycolicibacterium gilvum]STZ45853.1 membrane protein [Mycolicibacterium gilvum]